MRARSGKHARRVLHVRDHKGLHGGEHGLRHVLAAVPLAVRVFREVVAPGDLLMRGHPLRDLAPRQLLASALVGVVGPNVGDHGAQLVGVQRHGVERERW